MPVPEIDYDIQAINQLPLLERQPMWMLTVKAFISQVKRQYQIFRAYMNGEALALWSSTATYIAGNKVRWNFKTYESLIDANLNNTPDLSPSAWILRNNYFIGATERTLYNGGYLTLTWALNRQFNTTFRQPPYPAPYDYGLGGGTWSDIYIGNSEIQFATFTAAPDNVGSSVAMPIGSSGYATPLPLNAVASSYEFNVNIPIAVYNAQGTTNAIRDAIFNNFIALYAVTGTTWTLQTY